MNRRFARTLLAVAMLGVPIGIGIANQPAHATCTSVGCLPVAGALVLGSGGLPDGFGSFNLFFSLSDPDGSVSQGWIYGSGTLSGAQFNGSGNLGAYNYTTNQGFNSTVTVSATLATTGPLTGILSVQSTAGMAFKGAWAFTSGNTASNFQFSGLALVGP